MPRKKENFSQSNLTAAVEAVVNEGMSKKSAAKKFSVSRSTLQHRLNNPDQKVSCGPAPILSEEEEKTLEKWIPESSRKGFPQRKEDLLFHLLFLLISGKGCMKKKSIQKENRKKQRQENKLTKTKIVPVTKNITRKNVVRNIFKPLVLNKKPAETITSGLFENSKTKQFSDVLTLNTDECSNKSISSIYKNTGLCFRSGHSLNDVQNGLSCEFCSYIYHLKCLDKNEICNEGSGESILFICNSCQKNLTSTPM
ncbi:HTH CENPB-type domain-containing protein [Aphis craccivora]|uniref:HTH CENPB-type domain-containing protein n=1 Tax=Aphis craccivora TaxID=307492 RepID=A0A6G0W330_APHCR|nr:HTH CENPB-type domain-containing protein [Aphis craccivora]